jgi:hypothetical protein
LRAESLQRRDVLARTDGEDRDLLDDNVACFVAGCVFDAGAADLEWVADTISGGAGKLVMVGDGERSRHVAGIALDVGCPTGVIAQVVASCEEMNATVMAALLAPRGVFIPRDEIWHVPFLVRQGMLPIMLAVPPYSLWEPPAEGGLPEHGSAFGAGRLVEAFGFADVLDFHADGCDGTC